MHIRTFQYLITLREHIHAILVRLQRGARSLDAIWDKRTRRARRRRNGPVDECKDGKATDIVGKDEEFLNCSEILVSG